MSKLENGTALRYEHTNIGQLAKQCIDWLRPHLGERNIKIELLSQETADVDAVWICQAITLLLDNALRYTPPNAAITVSVSGDDCACWIAVRDCGPGISQKLQTGIFQKHPRAERQDKTIAGTGLGLPICRAIAEAHGGSIRMESSDSSTVFTMTLPITQPPTERKKTRFSLPFYSIL